MESNIKGLISAGHEMASELKAECGAVDMRSVAKLISDLATQLEVQLVRANALAEDQQKAIESIKQADSAVKLAHEKFSALAAENAALREVVERMINQFAMSGISPEEKSINPAASLMFDAKSALSMPATDAFTAEIRAEARNEGINYTASRAAMLHCAEPASKHEELPLDYLQGQKDGLEWAAQLAEANHPQTGDWLYDDPLDLAKAIRKGPDIPEFAGPHPVTPDGWISCSERMPEDTKMLLAFSQGQIVAAYWNWVMSPIDYKKYRAFTYLSGNILDDVTHWMPLPEPPQEVK
ncbi:DUF551 domain-containing protein [Escherichia coli]|nr:DUF551 domain-containing protein [Escherichia coli]